jgi:hypothetical protein
MNHLDIKTPEDFIHLTKESFKIQGFTEYSTDAWLMVFRTFDVYPKFKDMINSYFGETKKKASNVAADYVMNHLIETGFLTDNREDLSSTTKAI